MAKKAGDTLISLMLLLSSVPPSLPTFILKVREALDSGSQPFPSAGSGRRHQLSSQVGAEACWALLGRLPLLPAMRTSVAGTTSSLPAHLGDAGCHTY